MMKRCLFLFSVLQISGTIEIEFLNIKVGLEMSDNMNNYQIVLEQERLLVFDHFNYEDAWNLGSMIVNRARKQELAIAAEIWIGDYQVVRAAL